MGGLCPLVTLFEPFLEDFFFDSCWVTDEEEEEEEEGVFMDLVIIYAKTSRSSRERTEAKTRIAAGISFKTERTSLSSEEEEEEDDEEGEG